MALYVCYNFFSYFVVPGGYKFLAGFNILLIHADGFITKHSSSLQFKIEVSIYSERVICS